MEFRRITCHALHLALKRINQEGQGERLGSAWLCSHLALGTLEGTMFLTLDLLFDLLTTVLR